jgi:hypothetical protein
VRIHVALKVSDGHELNDVIVIEEHKLGELTDEEIESAIELRIRSWVDKAIAVEWEVEEEE